ncbi:hypothetical protein ALC57_01441 [Trachymyrmex cornetzi]|uniref:Uncharacterized protein n=1 Tax=Trachymyrmex cornetzi TaxID=471704 RepID=A0A151JQ98_9HYME|nr:hypothetical protein ALC57_01441 [Trachymyrmex cornetzi]
MCSPRIAMFSSVGNCYATHLRASWTRRPCEAPKILSVNSRRDSIAAKRFGHFIARHAARFDDGSISRSRKRSCVRRRRLQIAVRRGEARRGEARRGEENSVGSPGSSDSYWILAMCKTKHDTTRCGAIRRPSMREPTRDRRENAQGRQREKEREGGGEGEMAKLKTNSADGRRREKEIEAD